jgi:hypothetical protein
VLYVAKAHWIARDREDVIGLDICFEEVIDRIQAWVELLEVNVIAIEFELRDGDEGETEMDSQVLRLRRVRPGIEKVLPDGRGGLVQVSQTKAERNTVLQTPRFGEGIAKGQCEIRPGATEESDHSAQGLYVPLL